jgi:hypothetical protein
MKIKIFLILILVSLSNLFALVELKGLSYRCTQKKCGLDLVFDGKKLPAYKLTKKNVSGMVFKDVLIGKDTAYKLLKKSYLNVIELNQKGNNLALSLKCDSKCSSFTKIEKIKNGVRFVLEGRFKNHSKIKLKLPVVKIPEKKVALVKESKVTKSKSPKVKTETETKTKTKVKAEKVAVKPKAEPISKKVKTVKKVKALPKKTKVKKALAVKKVQVKSVIKRDTIAVMNEFISKDSLDYLKFKKEVSQVKTGISTKKSYSFKKEDRKLISISSTYLYTSPNLMSEKLEPISVGNKMTILSRHGIWVKVLYGRIKGFIPEAELSYEDELLAGQRERIEQYISLRLRKDSTSELSPRIPPYFIYSSFGKRDPFLPIALPEIDGISMDELRLVAIIWDSKDPMAILQDVRSDEISYNLLEGDRVINGSLSKILPNEVIFTLTEFGVTRNFSMILPHLTEAH